MLAAPAPFIQKQVDGNNGLQRRDLRDKRRGQLIGIGSAPNDDRPAEMVGQRPDGEVIPPSDGLAHGGRPGANGFLSARRDQGRVVERVVLEVLDAAAPELLVTFFSGLQLASRGPVQAIAVARNLHEPQMRRRSLCVGP